MSTSELQDNTVSRRPIITPHIPNSSISNSTPNNNKQPLALNVWYPRVLVFGPGGMKALKALGFLSPIEDSGLLEYVDTYGAVSVGALITLLMISGYSIREIVGEAVVLDIFKEAGSFDFNSILEHRGFISNEPVRKRLTQLIINKFGNVPTLYGLYMMTGKAFNVVTLNTTDEECVILNPFTHPDISCVDATMFSMNVPFLFYQLVSRGKVYVDGALANPYPVDYFDNGKTNILGIYMKAANTAQPRNIIQGTGTIIQRMEDTSTSLPASTYSLRIINALLDHRYYSIVQGSSSNCRHVCLDVKIEDILGYGVTTPEHKAALLVEGFNEGKTFISQLITDTYQLPKIPPKISYSYPPYFMIGEDGDSTAVDEPSNILEEMRINT